MRLFLVDDSHAVRKRLIDLANEIPDVDVVGTAATPAEAIAGLWLYRPDVAILDIHLGRQTAFDLLDIIGPELRGIVVMLITGGATDPYQVAAAKRGVRYLFDKATDIPQLLETLEELATERARSITTPVSSTP